MARSVLLAKAFGLLLKQIFLMLPFLVEKFGEVVSGTISSAGKVPIDLSIVLQNELCDCSIFIREVTQINFSTRFAR